MRADSKYESVGNATMLGQIATFMESLHLSYREVVYEIPYRNLNIMLKDKLHSADKDDVRREVSDAEFFKMKGIKFSKDK